MNTVLSTHNVITVSGISIVGGVNNTGIIGLGYYDFLSSSIFKIAAQLSTANFFALSISSEA